MDAVKQAVGEIEKERQKEKDCLYVSEGKENSLLWIVYPKVDKKQYTIIRSVRGRMFDK